MQVAIVTGGAQGIGKAITKEFLENGIKVVIADNDQEAGNETQKEYGEIGEILFCHGDSSKEDDVIKTVRQAMDRFGKINILVNNAGIANPYNGPVENLSLENWQRVIDVNLTGYFLFAKHSIPHLRNEKGKIINISSTRSGMSEPNTEAYSASKGGVDSLTHALANSVGPEITVNAISPGWINVEPWKKKQERKNPAFSKDDHLQHPAGRIGTPEDISRLALFLVQQNDPFITGANFVVDGGMTKKMIYLD